MTYLGLTEATQYLGSRARVCTPMGALEFLEFNQCVGAEFHQRERETFDKRIDIMLACMDIYRNAFPGEYARSNAPHFSIQREHELYRLINRILFPLQIPAGWGVEELTDIESHLADNPSFQLPFIPLRGIQKHTWAPGLIEWNDLELVFKVAHACIGNWFEVNGEHLSAAEALAREFDQRDCPPPLPALAAVGWSLFTYSCAVETTPLKWWTLPFNMIGYKTGNPWLDLPPVGSVGFEWSIQELMRLRLARANAEDLLLSLAWLNDYFAADPAHITRAIEIWNDAVMKEQQSGFAGVELNVDTQEMYLQ